MADFEHDSTALADLRKLAAREHIRGKPTARDVMHDCQVIARGLVLLSDRMDDLDAPGANLVHPKPAPTSNGSTNAGSVDDVGPPASEVVQPTAKQLAYRGGYAAGKAGKPLSSCPLGRHTGLFSTWSGGWAAGREDRSNPGSSGNAAAVTCYRRRVADRDMRAECPDAPDYPDASRSKYVGASRRGWFACFAGETKAACPYGDGRGASAFRNRWLEGFDLAATRKAEQAGG